MSCGIGASILVSVPSKSLPVVKQFKFPPAAQRSCTGGTPYDEAEPCSITLAQRGANSSLELNGDSRVLSGFVSRSFDRISDELSDMRPKQFGASAFQKDDSCKDEYLIQLTERQKDEDACLLSSRYVHCLNKVYDCKGADQSHHPSTPTRSYTATPTKPAQSSPLMSPSSLSSMNGILMPMPDFKGASLEVNTPRSICCDACAGCADTCGDPDCRRCASKLSSVQSRTPILESISCMGASKRLPSYSMCQVQRLCKNGKCLLIAEGNVYDATGFLDSHPAGAASIARKVGQDCTVDFGFHSVKARKEIWSPLQIGKLVPCRVHGPSKDKSICSLQ